MLSLKVIENSTMQSGAHDFLLTLQSNHQPISHRFRDNRRYPLKFARKSPTFATPGPRVFIAPAEGVRRRIVYRRRGLKKLTRMIVLSDGRRRSSADADNRLDALALSVIATVTWLAGWLAGWVAGCHTPVLYQNR